MVKRVNHLFDRVIDFSNLIAAWKKAQKGTGWTSETYQFFYELERELLTLNSQLQENCYQPGQYRYFNINDPKPRIIAVAPFRDRVVHHALVNVLMPIFETTFINASYATRVGKGTHVAIEHAQGFVRNNRWYYKMDIEHFFETVDHNLMLALIARKIKDQRVLLLTERIIRNAPGNKGLPIGNLTSQFFANVYLNPLDHFIKEGLRIKAYLRYMDDFVIFGDDKAMLQDQHRRINEYVNNRLLLRMKEKATWLNRSSAGLSYLGMRIFPGMLRIRPENRNRCLKRLKIRQSSFEHGYLSEAQLADSMTCVKAHLHYFCPGQKLIV